jgi:hypothetical protein
MGTQPFVIGIAKFGPRDSGQRSFAAGKIQYDLFHLVRLFIDEPKSGEVVSEVTPDGCRCRPEQFVNVQLGDDVVVDLQQQPQPVSFFRNMSLGNLCGVPGQRALERDRNVGCKRTKQLDVFGDEFLSPLLCHCQNAEWFVRGRDGKHIGASAHRFRRKWSQRRMFQHFLRYVREENRFLFLNHLRHGANA